MSIDGTLLVQADRLSIGVRNPARRLVDSVSFTLKSGETLGILGESGSGKTLTLRSLIGALPARQFDVSGSLVVLGDDAVRGGGRPHRRRGNAIAMIYQDPAGALDPLWRIGAQIVEALRTHRDMDATAAKACAMRALEQVQFAEPGRIFLAYPHELSGGQKQRVAIAMALLHEPRVLLADEPTTALDLTTQAHLLHTIKGLQASHGMGIVLVSHDVGVIAEMADQVLVMERGKIVEHGNVEDVLCRPRHRYTQALLAAKAEMLAGLAGH